MTLRLRSSSGMDSRCSATDSIIWSRIFSYLLLVVLAILSYSQPLIAYINPVAALGQCGMGKATSVLPLLHLFPDGLIRISCSAFGRPCRFRHPETSSKWTAGKGRKGRKRSPLEVSSIANSVPGPQPLRSLAALGITI